MDKPRRKRKLPFGYNPKAARRHAKFKRAQANMTKAEIAEANAAVLKRIAEHRAADPNLTATQIIELMHNEGFWLEGRTHLVIAEHAAGRA